MSEIKNMASSPFHIGEQQVQERLGVRDIDAWARKVVRDHLPEEHRAFHTGQPFIVVSARDKQDRPWATLLDGPDGFVKSPDPQHLVIETKPSPGDALAGAFNIGAEIGILGIELATRRRNRVNGRIVSNSQDAVTFRVDQAFGNCPQYIREREWRRVEKQPLPKAIRAKRLTATQRKWIEASDTFFIASGFRGEGESPTFGMDVSHRGGESGFVQVVDDTCIQFPDYAGNNHYNTIGNLVLDPRAGFLFVDFDTGSLLQLTGATSIDWESDRLKDFPGARRLITLNIEEIIEIRNSVGLRWQAETGSVRSLRLIEKISESSDVTSFVFEARDGGSLAAFEPGQHLPLELDIPGIKEPARRTYSLSNSPGDGGYRITVKREENGLVSKYLHDNVEPGAIIDGRHPAGDFMMTCNICPLVLVSAGVGVTPMMSILHTVASEKGNRPIWFVHGARDGNHHPFANEIGELALSCPNINVHVAYSQPGPDDRSDTHYDSQGRVTGTLLANLVQNMDAHYFVCGPKHFMTEILAELGQQGVPADQIHFETFGPVS